MAKRTFGTRKPKAPIAEVPVLTKRKLYGGPAKVAVTPKKTPTAKKKG